jgi:hypothetical protein
VLDIGAFRGNLAAVGFDLARVLAANLRRWSKGGKRCPYGSRYDLE